MRLSSTRSFPAEGECVTLSISRHMFHFWRETCMHCQVKAAWRLCHRLGCLSVRSSAFNDFPQFSWSDLTDKGDRQSLVSFGLVLFYLVLFGWFCFVWFRFDWFRFGWFHFGWFRFIWFGFVSQTTVSRFRLVWFGFIWFCLVGFVLVGFVFKHTTPQAILL